MTPPAFIRRDRHLVEDANGRAAIDTYVGMAFLAGSGPAGRVCRECQHYVEPVYRKQLLTKGRCSEFSRQRQGTIGAKFPATVACCKYFAERSDPHPLQQKIKRY